MPRLARTIHAFATSGDDLACATLFDAPVGARLTSAPTIAGARTMPAEQLRARLPKVGAGDGVIFVCPSSHAHARAFGVGASAWHAAEEDIRATIATLFPLTPEDALVGVVDAADGGDDDHAPEGVLVAASREQLRAWTEHLGAALGRSPDAVVAPVQCVPTLGFQHLERAIVREHVGMGEVVEHELRLGLPGAVGNPPDPDRAPDAQLPSDEPTHATARTAHSTPPGTARTAGIAATGGGALERLARAAAALPRSAPKHVVAIDGALPAGRSRWLIPALAGGLALVLTAAALQAPGVRTSAALERLSAEEARLADDVAEAAALRRETLTLERLIETGYAGATAGWSPALPVLREASRMIPEGGYAWEIVIEGETLRLSGVAQDSGAVLARVESSPVFTGASFVAPPGRSPDPEDGGGERFDLRATIVQEGGAR